MVSTFFPGSLDAYDYRGAKFALPHNIWTPVTFYTKDTLDKMGWQVPNTWDDVRAIIPKTKAQKMEFAYRPGFISYPRTEDGSAAAYMPFLYQHGGDFFSQDGLKSALDAEEAIAAFREFTDLFTKHKVPLEVDMRAMLERGEMPIMINADHHTQWMRSALASKGRGDVLRLALLPGMMRGGKLDRTGVLYSWSQYMMKASKNKKETWEYLKWYYSKDASSAVIKGWGKLIPGLTWKLAVQDATQDFLKTNFPTEMQVLFDQVAASRYIRPVLGGFALNRFVTNAVNEVTLKGIDPEEAIRRAASELNKEMVKKQKEFARFVY
jgi:ABC-type glycerol-3-phosphate transport system substrate-binding protein